MLELPENQRGGFVNGPGMGASGQSLVSKQGSTNGACRSMQREFPNRTAFPKTVRPWHPRPQFVDDDHPGRSPWTITLDDHP